MSALPPAEIFKAYDIRGIVERSLTAANARAIGQAIGSEARDRGVRAIAVARDGRLSGPMLVEALTQGILAAGMDVIDVGRVPTPVLYFATHHLGTYSGVMVTGSHNPPDYNGFKMMLAGETLSGDSIQALRARLADNRLHAGVGKRSEADVREAYLDRVTEDVRPQRRLKVVIDCGNGVAGEMAPALLKRLDCEVHALYCEIDGTFPNHHPDPSQPENLHDIIAAVKAEHADVGLAFDGDGDRLGVIAPDGQVIWPDRQMVLYARDILARNPGAQIIYDVKCSRLLHEAIEAAGGQPLMWKTGHSFIKAKLKDSGALLAGEMSGHIFFKERWYGFDDALYTAARLVEILAATDADSQSVFAALPNAINTPELRLELAREGEQHALMRELLKVADFADAKATTIDGLRVDFEDGWGLVRPSNTTPILVLRFEGRDTAALGRIQERFRNLLRRARPDINIPF